MKRWLISLSLVCLWTSLAFSSTCRPPTLPASPTVEQIMRHWFDIKFTRYADDVVYPTCRVILIDKLGFKREKIAVRKRLILHGKKGFDYKDLVAIIYPEYTKGLAILSWAYMDINKQNDLWFWLPSMKKVRKISQAEEDDSFLGTEFTVEDISTRRYGYETYHLLGEDTFKGYTSHYDHKTYLANVPCYKVKAIPKKKDWYYTYRLIWIDKKTGIAIYDEYYDKSGRKFKEIFRYYETPPNGCWYSKIWEVYNFRTGHADVVLIDKGHFNTGLSERRFSPRILERMEW